MRTILHLDADAFFASVEQATDRRLRGKPIAVGGEKRGIVASASYEARKFGVYTPMPTSQARRICPRLIVLPGDFEKYELFSRLMFSYAYDFTPDVEIGSIDEGYFDLTGARKPAVAIGETIQRAIRQSLKLSVSEGIASNKLVSQIASKLKKPAAFQLVANGLEASFLDPLPNKWLPGIGPKTANQLNAAGLARIGQIAHTPAELLGLLVGSMALQLRNFAQGLDERPVIAACAPAKSYSEQRTFAADTTNEPFLEATLQRMADRLMAKVREDVKSIRTITVKVRYNDMDEQQASESLGEPTDLETETYSTISALLRKAWQRRVSLRLVSLKLSNLYDGALLSALPLDARARKRQAHERLAPVVDELRHKFGCGVVLRQHDFVLREEAKSKVQSPKSGVQGSQSKVESNEYGLAVAQRQRLGSYAARQAAGAPRIGRDLKGFNGFSRPGMLRDARQAGRLPHYGADHPRPFNSFNRFTYIPLNLHSYYSFLDSTLSIKAIIELAKRYELPAIALTDKNNLHGAVEFAQAATNAGIKPIIGAEIAWHGKRVCLYVQNQQGYHNLCRILSEEHREPFSDGLIAVSPAAELAQFFPGRFYLEINSPDTKPSTPLPCIASFPVHYELPSDRWKYDVVQSIRTLTLLRQQHPQKRLEGHYHFRVPNEIQPLLAAHPDLFAHTAEIAERCSFAFSLGKPQFPGYVPADGSSSADFLRRLAMDGLQRRYPDRHARLRPQLEQELAIITEVGYEEYFLVMWDILQECRRRDIEWITRGSAADSLVCYCLEISGVCPIRFDLYFRRFLNKERMALNKLPDIDVDFPHDRKDDVIDLIFEKYGPEHTSVVGGFSTFQSRSAFAEVAKVLGVSDYQVRRITERFPHYARAGELAEAIADTQECRDLPFEEEPYRTALKMARFLDGFPRYPKMHPCGLVLSRQPMSQIVPCFISAKNYPTTHFDMDSIEAVGLVKMDILAQGGLAVMRDVKEMLNPGLNLNLNPNPNPNPNPKEEINIKSKIKIKIKNPASPIIDLDALEPWEDPEVWALIAHGHARAVHHIESPAMISLCKMCNVQDIDTLIAIVSVIRPGAANESKKMEFARRYQGLSPITYPHPSLEPCLRSTYGLVVYEEHILQICETFAGLPPGRADVLRRALAKGKTELIHQIQTEFTDCARKRGRTEGDIAQVWDLVAGFKGYAFCKAHSTAYGVEAYQSAWLKRYYPAEFMAAVLTNGKGFYDPLVYVLECHRLGIPLLPPSVNQPGPQFTVVAQAPVKLAGADACATRKQIRVPLLNVKGVTVRTKETILRERQRGVFTSLTDFHLRVRPLNEEMEAMIQAGAFDEFGQPRTTQYWQFKALSASVPARQREKGAMECSGGLKKGASLHHSSSLSSHPSTIPSFHHSNVPHQLWLFPPGNLDRLPSVPLAQPDRLQRLRWEEQLFGYPVSGHPLELYPHIAWETYCPINQLDKHVGEQIVTCGLVIEQRLFHQITGEPMKFLTIADWTGVVETELFARTYRSYGLNTVRYRVLEIAARVEPFENGRGHTLRVLRAGKPRTGCYNWKSLL